MRRFLSSALAFAVVFANAQIALGSFMPAPSVTVAFEAPMDAFSVRLPSVETHASYRSKSENGWSDWKSIEIDTDVGTPGERESDLILLDSDVSAIEVTGVTQQSAVHPIAVSKEPVSYKVASLVAQGTPKILARADWGADESYRFEVPKSSSDQTDATKGDNSGGGGETSAALTQRIKDCQAMQSAYPEEFKIDRTVTKDADGKSYLWPLQYSKGIKTLVVHHTALLVRDDPRPGAERMRALYKYHAQNRGWGDIGYNYVVDEDGQIYEGRAGGDHVIAGHAYCNNVNTIGIALMGNFELELPSQAQMKALQWLLRTLADKEHIDVSKSMQFHGKKYLTPILGHKDLLSTACPGYYVASVLSQVRTNVMEKRADASIVFPAAPPSGSSSSTSSQKPQALGLAPGISFIGRSAVSINPGGMQRISFTYTAPQGGAYEGKKVADVKLSSKDIKLWIDDGFSRIPISTGVLLPSDLPGEETLSFQLILQAPLVNGNYAFDVGGIHFTLAVFGRRARTGEYINPFASSIPVRTLSSSKSSVPVKSVVRPQTRRTRASSSASSQASSYSSISTTSSASSPIRIKLSTDPAFSVAFAEDGMVNDLLVRAGTTLSVILKNGECELQNKGARFTSGPQIRLRSSKNGTLTVVGVKGFTRGYRGVLECRVVNGVLTLINELPLEDYMLGLAEEPDTEPYEKQRAFAIAARTYAAYYMQSTQRKFPGLPYDGSDDPAVFQSYHGVDFEARNPEWARAVRATANEVLFYKSAIIKPPYFSSDDGKTRTPAQAGWNNFPNAELFSSKEDPWCAGLTLRGHGVGMSGCGALGQAKEGRSAEQILQYYYPGVRITER